MNRLKKTLAGVALSLAAVTTANAGVVVLDDFDYSPDPVVNLSVSSSSPTDNTTRFDINAFDADVAYQLDYVNGPTSATAEGFAVLSDSQISLNNNSQVNSTLSMFYSGLNGTPATPLNFADLGSAFYFDVIESDAGFTYTVTVTDSSTNTSVLVANTTDVSTPERQTLDFTNFAGTADFSSVASVLIEISTVNPSVDLTLTEFGIVPEPASLAIFGAGLLGLAGLRRRKNQA